MLRYIIGLRFVGLTISVVSRKLPYRTNKRVGAVVRIVSKLSVARSFESIFYDVEVR